MWTLTNAIGTATTTDMGQKAQVPLPAVRQLSFAGTAELFNLSGHDVDVATEVAHASVDRLSGQDAPSPAAVRRAAAKAKRSTFAPGGERKRSPVATAR